MLPEPLINNYADLIPQLQKWKIKRKFDLPITRHSRYENRGVGVVLMVVRGIPVWVYYQIYHCTGTIGRWQQTDNTERAP